MEKRWKEFISFLEMVVECRMEGNGFNLISWVWKDDEYSKDSKPSKDSKLYYPSLQFWIILINLQSILQYSKFKFEEIILNFYG